jgi:hypothetical protein
MDDARGPGTHQRFLAHMREIEPQLAALSHALFYGFLGANGWRQAA